jgi:hypothetical protein
MVDVGSAGDVRGASTRESWSHTTTIRFRSARSVPTMSHATQFATRPAGTRRGRELPLGGHPSCDARRAGRLLVAASAS